MYFLSFYEKHIVPRRIIPSWILYNDVLEAFCSIDIGYLIGGLWGKPHDFWCAPLTPFCTFMLISCKMIVAANKWLEKHLFLFDLMQARDALHWFLVWDLDTLSDCHVTTCFYWFLLPCIADFSFDMGSFVWKVGHELKMPIGSMILPTLHYSCFRGSNGQPMISKLHLFSSCGMSHLKNLRRHFMIYLFGGVAWATLRGHGIWAQDQQQPHTYHKWREKPFGWEDPISPCSTNTLYESGVEDIF